MDINEARLVFLKYQKQGLSDDDIINALAHFVVNDDLDVFDLQAILKENDYKLNPKFINSNKKKQIKLIMKNKVIIPNDDIEFEELLDFYDEDEDW